MSHIFVPHFLEITASQPPPNRNCPHLAHEAHGGGGYKDPGDRLQHVKKMLQL